MKRRAFITPLGGAAARGRRSLAYANRMLWFFSGNVRMRCPVAAKMALSTAGAATKIVGYWG